MDKIKHLFETRSGMISKIKLSDYAYGDHKMLVFMLTKKKNTPKGDPIRKRNWTKYNKETLMVKLSSEDWTCDRNDVQSFFNWMESKLINIIDSLAPIETRYNQPNTYQENETTTRPLNKKRKHLKNWKKHGR